MIRHANDQLAAVGVSFKTLELSSRSRFAFNADACRVAYASAPNDLSFFILSTCNRTELYGWTHDLQPLSDILRRQGLCNEEEFARMSFSATGKQAADRLFRVAAGLESQIVGDYDIISQIKTAFQCAKAAGRVNGLLEKTYNFALQTSKEVKNQTAFSDGTLSIPYAVVKKLASIPSIQAVTVVGAGDTGELVIRYLRSHLPNCQIRLVNRHEERLHQLGARYDVLQFPIAALAQSLVDSQAVVVTTNAPSPLLFPEHLSNSDARWVFDLSVPRNVAPSVYGAPGLHVLDTDKLSETIQENMTARLAEVPKVESIVASSLSQYQAWLDRRSHFSNVPRAPQSDETL